MWLLRHAQVPVTVHKNKYDREKKNQKIEVKQRRKDTNQKKEVNQQKQSNCQQFSTTAFNLHRSQKGMSHS